MLGFWNFQTLLVWCWEEGGDDAKSACPSDASGYTRDTMDGTAGSDGVTLSGSFKAIPSSD